MEASGFGAYLKRIRKEKKLTIRQLELYSNVSNAYISQIERGERGVPSPDILRKLSKPLGVDYEELMQKAGHLPEGITVEQREKDIADDIEFFKKMDEFKIKYDKLPEDEKEVIMGMMDLILKKHGL